MTHGVDVVVSALDQWTDSKQGLQDLTSLEKAIEQIKEVASSRIKTIHDVKQQVRKPFKKVKLLKQYIQSEKTKIVGHQDLKEKSQVLENRIKRIETHLEEQANQHKILKKEGASVQRRLAFLKRELTTSQLMSSVDHLIYLAELIQLKKDDLKIIEQEIQEFQSIPQRTLLKINANGLIKQDLLKKKKELTREIEQLEAEKTRINNQVIQQNQLQMQNPQLSINQPKERLLKKIQELERKQLQINEEAEMAKTNADLLEKTLPQQRQELEKINAQLLKIKEREEKISRAQFKQSELEYKAQKIWMPAQKILQMTKGYKEEAHLLTIVQFMKNKIEQLEKIEQAEIEKVQPFNEWVHAITSFLYYLSYILLVYVVGGSIAMALSPALLLGYLTYSLTKNQELLAN